VKWEGKVGGRALLREVILMAAVFQSNAFLIAMLVSLVRAWIPFVVKAFDPDMEPFSYDLYGVIFETLNFLMQLLFVFFNVFFVVLGLMDFQRRLFLINALSSMIQPFKANIKPKYLMFPTINICDDTSLRTWILMRTAALDLGRKYLARIFLYSSFFLGLYTFYLVVFLLNFFKVLKYNFPMILNAYAIFDIGIVLGVIFLMFVQGAFVNAQFQKDIGHMRGLKDKILYAKHNVAGMTAPGKMYQGAEMKFYQEKFREMLKTKSEEECVEHCDKLIEEVDFIIEKLEHDEVNNPLKLLGITATFQLVQAIVTTGFTLVGAVV